LTVHEPLLKLPIAEIYSSAASKYCDAYCDASKYTVCVPITHLPFAFRLL
jgi:hypothetical protein